MPSKVWLSQETYDELWALTHNFRLRMQSNVKKAAVLISGSGKRAAVNILLPATAGSGNADYDGYFKLVNDSDDENLFIGVVNGADEDDEICGKVSVGGQWINVESVSLAPVGEHGYVYLLIDYEYEDDSDTPTYTAAIGVAATLPPDYDSVAKTWRVVRQLGSYTVADNALTLAQAWTNGVAYITDRWA